MGIATILAAKEPWKCVFFGRIFKSHKKVLQDETET